MGHPPYVSILIFILVALLCGLGPLVLGAYLGPRRPNAEKNSPYECGFEPFKDARLPFDVRFYRWAILFILFDLEIVFLFPFALIFRDISTAGLIGIGLFLFLLSVGFIVEWKKGALAWD